MTYAAPDNPIVDPDTEDAKTRLGREGAVSDATMQKARGKNASADATANSTANHTANIMRN